MKATLSLTHNCNLDCRYCYAGRKYEDDMPPETMRRAVDFAFGLAQPGRPIDFSFFGGEPLLRMDLVEQGIRYIRDREQATGQPIVLSLTCNGTLLTPPVREFLRREQVDLCISIDGPEHVHNLNRRRRDGSGSHAEVVRNLQAALAELSSVQVNAVFGPDTVAYLPETVDFFIDCGVPVIHLNPNIRAAWDAETCRGLAAIYLQMAERYIESYRRGRELAVNLIDAKIIVFLKGGYAAEDMCGMGDTEWAIAPSGNIYPCERFIGEDDDRALRLGNVYTGIDPRRRCAILAGRGNRNAECSTCDWSKYCMNWCGCTNHALTGATDLASPVLCASERGVLQAARHVLSTLTNENNALFIDHFMRYINLGRSCPTLR